MAGDHFTCDCVVRFSRGCGIRECLCVCLLAGVLSTMVKSSFPRVVGQVMHWVVNWAVGFVLVLIVGYSGLVS